MVTSSSHMLVCILYLAGIRSGSRITSVHVDECSIALYQQHIQHTYVCVYTCTYSTCTCMYVCVVYAYVRVDMCSKICRVL